MMAAAVKRGWSASPGPLWRTANSSSSQENHLCRSLSPQTARSDRLEVLDDGNLMKVRTEEPHLVSLGSGRLSTAVTLLPLPEGRVLLGCGGCYGQRQPDIVVEGTGVEPQHCFIENNRGVVTLVPLGELTSIDGLRIVAPVRLTQGSMICIGRSNYFRFNHPQEAELMKTILPNTRISSVPLQFAAPPNGPGVDNPEYFHMSSIRPNGNSSFAPVRSSSPQYIGEYLHPRTLPRYDDEDDIVAPGRSASPSPMQQYQLAAASPKVFLPTASTVSLPASAVIGARGRSATPTGPAPSNNESGHRRSHSVGNGQNLALSLAPRRSTASLCGKTQQHEPQHQGHAHCSMEALQACEEQLEEKRRQAHEDRLKEEEVEQEERARLDEILQLCAEYQRQIEEESQGQAKKKPTQETQRNSGHQSSFATTTSPNLTEAPAVSTPPPTTGKPPLSPGHSLHPNRIKTNGSLPRERRLQSPGFSRNLTASEDELSGIFSFDSPASPEQNSSASIGNCKSPYENVNYPQSPRTRIRTTVMREKREDSPESVTSPPRPGAAPMADLGFVSPTLANDAAKEELVRLKKERQQILCLLSTLKNRVNDVEQQIREAFREAEMESALLVGEASSQQDKFLQDDKLLTQLRDKDVELEQELEAFKQKEYAKITSAKVHMESVERDLEFLEQQLDSFQGNTDEETALLEKIKHQHEYLDAERKTFEDLEFHVMEAIAHKEAEREEVHKEMAAVELRLLQRKQQLLEVDQQQRQATENARKEAAELDLKRQALFREISQEKEKLSKLQQKLEELFQAGIAAADGDLPSTDYSSDPEEEDLDVIGRIASRPAVDPNSSTLGRKASATMQEIERNRQILLVQQGSQVLEQERRRVAELKRKVQDEVRQQWEERKLQEREMNCHSLNSVGSEDSSTGSSDLPPDSVSSDDILGKTCTTASSPCRDSSSVPSASISSILEVKVRQKEHELQQALEDCRPLSEASSCGDEFLEVRIRDRQKNQQQRPLTRYLPIRGEEFDLRQHVESAGHQVELCPHLVVTSTAARGYLHKMGSRFRTWKKRWFVFDRNQRTFLYFADKTEVRPRGGAYFQAIEEVYVDHLQSVRSPNAKLTFCVKTRERVYHLMAPSAEAMRIWIDVVFTGAEGYQQFQHLS